MLCRGVLLTWTVVVGCVDGWCMILDAGAEGGGHVDDETAADGM